MPGGALRIAHGLQVVIQGPACFELRLDDRRWQSGPRTLEILHEFTTPASAQDVIATLGARARGVADWMQLTNIIVSLARFGMLVSAAESQSRPKFSGKSDFAAAGVHIAMLNDHHRTRSFLDAIAAVVKPGDVVVDLGTGSGVLAVAAVKAGAERVYAIEETRIGDLARQVFQANGVDDKIHLLEGNSAQISLPERADVLVSEIIGNDPFGESVLESMGDAVGRFLKPDARMIPNHLAVYAAPVEMPTKELEESLVTPASVARWYAAYGIDFTPLAIAARLSPFASFARPRDLVAWPLLAEPQVAYAHPLAVKLHAQKAVDLAFTTTRAGRCDGIALWFSLSLAPGIELTTDPRTYRDDNHWFNPIWCFGDSVELAEGDHLAVRLPDRSNLRGMTVSRSASSIAGS